MSSCPSTLLISVLVATCGVTDSRYQPVAWPPAGPLRGLVESHSNPFAVFRGVPYGEPPVGRLRFAPPVPAASWKERRDAVGPSTRCAGSTAVGSSRAETEDCLNLDLWAPLTVFEQLGHDQSELLPVVVVFGDMGDHVDPVDWSAASQLHSVLVRVNHRHGALGYMAHQQLTLQYPAGAANAALLDQRLALEWVQQHVKHFGGDAAQVTVFADGMAATEFLWQLTATDARMDAPLLYQTLLLHKPRAVTVQAARTIQAEEEGEQLMRRVDCDSFQCMQRVPWPKLVRAAAKPPHLVQWPSYWVPTDPCVASNRQQNSSVCTPEGLV